MSERKLLFSNKKILQLLTFLKRLKRLKQEWLKIPAWTRQTDRKHVVWFGEIERKIVKLSKTTFTYRSSSLLFYGLIPTSYNELHAWDCRPLRISCSGPKLIYLWGSLTPLSPASQSPPLFTEYQIQQEPTSTCIISFRRDAQQILRKISLERVWDTAV